MTNDEAEDWTEYEKTATVDAIRVEAHEDLPDHEDLTPLVDLDTMEEDAVRLEGNVTVEYPVFLVRNPDGNLHPVHPDVFEETYQEVMPNKDGDAGEAGVKHGSGDA
jgi:hypothetical protein